MIKDLKGDVEKEHVMHEKLKEDSTHSEVMCETLVEKLKDEFCRAMCNSKDEHYSEFEDTMKNIEKEFYLDVREEYFEGLEQIVEAKEIIEVMKMKERDKKVASERDENF